MDPTSEPALETDPVVAIYVWAVIGALILLSIWLLCIYARFTYHLMRADDDAATVCSSPADSA